MRTVLASVLVLGFAVQAYAQQPAGRPDFLFGAPSGAIAVRGNLVVAREGSDFFPFVRQTLTVDKGAFNTGGVAADYGIRLTPRLEAVVGFDANRARISSEYRNLVDNNRLPIEQTTTLRSLNFTGNLRYALTPRGREISRLAWVPRAVVPYVGAGGGLVAYQLKQAGDFVDALDPRMPVFAHEFSANGVTPSAQVFSGVDVRLHGRWYATIDGRYVWAAGNLGRDFESFDPIDLSGFRFGAGINILF
jgi:hypothetical protein